MWALAPLAVPSRFRARASPPPPSARSQGWDILSSPSNPPPTHPPQPRQGKSTLSDTLSLIFTAVTYHELFQLAARDALSAIAALDWSALYRRLAAAEAAEGPRFGAEAAQAELMEMGASAAEARAATQVLFASDGRIIPEATFVARAARTMAPLRLAAAAGG